MLTCRGAVHSHLEGGTDTPFTEPSPGKAAEATASLLSPLLSSFQSTKLWIIMEYLGGGSALDLVSGTRGRQEGGCWGPSSLLSQLCAVLAMLGVSRWAEPIRLSWSLRRTKGVGGQTGGLGGFWDTLVPHNLFLPVSTHTHIHLAPKLFEFWWRLPGSLLQMETGLLHASTRGLPPRGG